MKETLGLGEHEDPSSGDQHHGGDKRSGEGRSLRMAADQAGAKCDAAKYDKDRSSGDPASLPNCDHCEVSDLQCSTLSNHGDREAGIDHVFCDEEINYAKKRKCPYQHYAARFAAKEAILKAIGDNAHVSWKDMKSLFIAMIKF